MLKYRLTILAFGILFTVQSQDAEHVLSKANRYYTEKEYEKANELYLSVLKKDPGNFNASYNLAAGFFKTSRYDEAIKIYEQLEKTAATTGDKSNVLYNSANALVKLNLLETAVEKYKQALILNPADADCRYNLTKAMEELKKKSRQKKQDQQKQDHNKQNEKQNPEKELQQNSSQTLQMLRRKEKNVQERLKQQQKNGAPASDKDW